MTAGQPSRRDGKNGAAYEGRNNGVKASFLRRRKPETTVLFFTALFGKIIGQQVTTIVYRGEAAWNYFSASSA